ncbi:MAG: hypothetical protein JWM05_2226, partial [Acidimicrobiales bacterium]|nr:hypothetical protein [Acidimicrobiales bacterium]
NRPSELARERPRSTPAMTVAELTAKGIPVQPLDVLAEMVVVGIREERFTIVYDIDKQAETLRSRAEAFARHENPTVMHHVGG